MLAELAITVSIELGADFVRVALTLEEAINGPWSYIHSKLVVDPLSTLIQVRRVVLVQPINERLEIYRQLCTPSETFTPASSW